MIYWNVTNNSKDRYSVWMNGKEIAKYLTFDDCYTLVMQMIKERDNATNTIDNQYMYCGLCYDNFLL